MSKPIKKKRLQERLDGHKTGEGEWFTSAQVTKMMDMKRVTLQDRLMRGYVTAGIEATGRGGRHLFSRQDLYQLHLFSELLRNGLSRDAASRRLALFREKRDSVNKMEGGFLVFVREEGELSMEIWDTEAGDSAPFFSMDKVRGMDEIQCINYGKIIAEVDHLIERYL